MFLLLTAKKIARCLLPSSIKNKYDYPLANLTKRHLLKYLIMLENDISKIIIDCAIEVHKSLGPGLLESAYLECLLYELQKAGLQVEKQKPLPLVYKEIKLDVGYRINLIVERKVIIELKSVEALNEIHMAQVLTYLKLSGCKLGLLMNFNVLRLVDGIKRLANKL
jgi:GxxExxY protein